MLNRSISPDILDDPELFANPDKYYNKYSDTIHSARYSCNSNAFDTMLTHLGNSKALKWLHFLTNKAYPDTQLPLIKAYTVPITTYDFERMLEDTANLALSYKTFRRRIGKTVQTSGVTIVGIQKGFTFIDKLATNKDGKKYANLELAITKTLMEKDAISTKIHICYDTTTGYFVFVDNYNNSHSDLLNIIYTTMFYQCMQDKAPSPGPLLLEKQLKEHKPSTASDIDWQLIFQKMLMDSLTTTYPTYPYLVEIEKLYKDFYFVDILTAFIKKLSNSSLNNYIKQQQNTVESTKANITSLLRDYKTYLNTLTNAEFALETVSDRVATDTTQLLALLTQNKNISIPDLKEDSIAIAVNTPVRYYDKERMITLLRSNTNSFAEMITDMLRISENRSSNSYQKSYGKFKMTDFAIIQKALINLFNTTDYQLHFTNLFTLQIANSNGVTALGSYSNYANNGIKAFTYRYLPNPHIYNHACWDAAHTEINNQLRKGNFTQAITQLIATVAQLTETDTTVMRSLIKNFFLEPEQPTILNLATNKFISFLEYININKPEVKPNETN